MVSELFDIQTMVDPSQKLTREAAEDGVAAERIMRDYAAIGQTASALTVVVGDMANNLTGVAYQQPEVAESAGLPRDYFLNGGLVGSIVLRRGLQGYTGIGSALAARANSLLSDAYARVEMLQEEIRPEDRFTGYLTHIRIRPDETVITSVGDVYAWVNGKLVAGAEKEVDTRKEALISDLTQILDVAPDLRPGHIANVLNAFGDLSRLLMHERQMLYSHLIDAITAADTLDRQTVYGPVDKLVTIWQIRNLQNKPSSEHPWAYGAIDGTETPDEYVKVLPPIATADIQSLVIATDGSRPARPDAPVRAISDLEAVRPEFNEQTVVSLTRRVPPQAA